MLFDLSGTHMRCQDLDRSIYSLNVQIAVVSCIAIIVKDMEFDVSSPARKYWMAGQFLFQNTSTSATFRNINIEQMHSFLNG